MAKTRNLYLFPVAISQSVKVLPKESPAHVGRLRHAVDFIVPVGTPVRASASGVVVDIVDHFSAGGPSKKLYFKGNYVEIRHRFKEYSIYEHIKKQGAKVKVGDRVKAGQLVALSGKTGYLAHLGPHLHFDVHSYVGNGPEEYKSVEIRWKHKLPLVSKSERKK